MDMDFVAIAGGVGFILPLVISFAKQSTWSTQFKKAFSFVMALAAAVISVGAQEGWTTLNIEMIIGSMAVILPMAQTSYTGFWEDHSWEVKLASTFDRSSVRDTSGSDAP